MKHLRGTQLARIRLMRFRRRLRTGLAEEFPGPRASDDSNAGLRLAGILDEEV